jgi:protein-S-isoprenylcysteine O-methyltransferase Ste14
MDPTPLLLVTNLGLHAAFIWGRYRVFRIDNCIPSGVRLIEISATICILIGVVLIVTREGPQPGLDILAVVLAISSSALFGCGVATVKRGRLTAAFSSDVATELITDGPFRYVRHPFYVSYLLCYFQAVVLSRSGWAILPLLWMAGIYTHAALLEEQKFLNSPLAGEYHRYAARTGRFIPVAIHWRKYSHAD